MTHPPFASDETGTAMMSLRCFPFSLAGGTAGGRTMEPMNEIRFSREEKALIVNRIQLYFREELKQSIGQFDAEFLLDFFSAEVGAYYYNRGLYDAQAALAARLEDVQDAIFQLERPTDFRR